MNLCACGCGGLTKSVWMAGHWMKSRDGRNLKSSMKVRKRLRNLTIGRRNYDFAKRWL